MNYISVIIPCFNDAENIGELVTSVRENGDFIEAGDEILVIDDKSEDGSNLVAQNAKATVLCLSENSGPAVARNRGVAAARNDILVFLDSDTILEPGSLQCVRERFASPDGPHIVNGLCSPEPINETLGSFYKGLVEYSWHIDMIEKGVIPTIFNSRVGAMRKEVFQRTGGFDERIRGTELEEHEFSYRLPAGTRIELDPKLRVRHDFPGFESTIRVYWKRSAKWAELFMEHKKFDNGSTVGGTSLMNGLGHLFGALAAMTFAFAVFFPTPFLATSAALFLLFVIVNRLFFRLAFDISTGKAAAVFALHLFYSLVILGGAMYGTVRFMVTYLRKRFSWMPAVK